MRRIVKALSVTLSGLLIFFAAAWPLRADLMDGASAVTKRILPVNYPPGNYTISQLDAFRPSVSMVGGKTVSLPSASSMIDGSVVTICNTSQNNNTSHAVLQPTFPAPAFPRLWMQQCESVTSVSGTWQIQAWQGRWRPGFIPTLFVDNGGNDNNDGLVSNAAANALQNPQTCWTIFQREFDLGIIQPFCSPTGGQTFTGGIVCSAAGTPNVYFLTGNGGQTTIRNTSGSFVVQENDFCGYIIFDNVNLDCTSAGSHPCTGLFIHQQSGADLSTGGHTNGVTFTGANAGDLGLNCDSVCKVNSGAVVTLAGTLAAGIEGNQSSVFNIGSGINISASAAITSMFIMTQSSQLIYAGNVTFGAGSTLQEMFTLRSASYACLNFGTTSGTPSGRQFSVLNGSFLTNTSGNAIPGSAGITSAGGFLGGSVLTTSASGC